MWWNPYLAISDQKRNILAVVALMTVLVIWSLLSQVLPPAQLPSPLRTANALQYLAWYDGRSVLLEATLWSLGRVAMSAVLVVIIGVPVGILMGADPRINAVLSPLVDPFRSAPVVAFLPILVMWLGIGEGMKVAFLFLGAVVYLIPMVRDAVRAVPQTYWISAYDLGATPFEAVTKAVVPMAKPRIADAIVVSVSIIWTYITVAEYVNAVKGLGQLLQNAKRMGAMDHMFVSIAVIVLVALLTFQGMSFVKKKLYPWEVE